MRPVLHGDVASAARALLAVPRAQRDALCVRMIREAGIASRHVQRTGRIHLLFGNGSLMSAARKRVLADEPGFDDVEYCQCFETVLRAVVRARLSRTRS
ncbi:hypothetical protein SAMN05444007_103146 [Cribrihabitans marinus]|jgi:hypothetical protein|uniref:DUF7742 domain-containing protein n=1 Tax=Cribrihabitans marinus TaxID=1227549 RepID=A0A1H6VBQ7_9RHOB|nr:hypothetical protein [Cribrihabitans marinus]GGH25998.1 hypothetical protein GCM10010973_13510 [Cribrihabitans marinus]SEJ02001.1 hypothetical protein SAMN05444007_103146 [Cribrihabitans marinus]